MKRAIILEVIWLVGCLIAAWFLFHLLSRGDAQDITVRESYITDAAFSRTLPPLMYFVFIDFITIGFWVYLIRVLYSNFKVILTDTILLIFAGMVLYFLYDTVFVLHPPMVEPHVIENGSSTPVTGLFYGSSYSSSYIWGTRTMKIFLTLILAFTGFMVGRNWEKALKK